MLYDPKWHNPEVKADHFTIESLIAWLGKHPAGKSYDYYDPCHCVLAEYAFEHGITFYDMAYRTGWDFEIAACEPHTYGAALDRAYALQNDLIPIRGIGKP